MAKQRTPCSSAHVYNRTEENKPSWVEDTILIRQSH